MKKAAPKAQKGKKVDGNTNAQKLMLDNKYNSVYRSMQNDSIKASNRSLPSTYEKLRRANAGKSPSAAKLRSAQDKLNKTEVKYANNADQPVSLSDPKGKQKMEIRENIRKALKKTQGKSPLDARGRTEEVMKNFAMNSYKSGGKVKKAQNGVKKSKVVQRQEKFSPSDAGFTSAKDPNYKPPTKKYQMGGSVQEPLKRKLPKKAPIKKIPVKKAPTSKPSMNTIVPTGGRNFYDIDMSKKDRISPEMSRKGKSIKKSMLAKSGTKLKKK
jgi:hypothetical protein